MTNKFSPWRQWIDRAVEIGRDRGAFPPQILAGIKAKPSHSKDFGFLFAHPDFQIFLRFWIAQDFFLWVRRLYRRRLKGTSILQNSALVPSSSLYSLLVVQYVAVLLHSNLHQQAPMHSNLKCIFLLAMAHIGVKDFFRKWKFFIQSSKLSWKIFQKFLKF